MARRTPSRTRKSGIGWRSPAGCPRAARPASARGPLVLLVLRGPCRDEKLFATGEEERIPVRIDPPDDSLNVERIASVGVESKMRPGAWLERQLGSHQLGAERAQVQRLGPNRLAVDFDCHCPVDCFSRMPPQISFALLEQSLSLQS